MHRRVPSRLAAAVVLAVVWQFGPTGATSADATRSATDGGARPAPVATEAFAPPAPGTYSPPLDRPVRDPFRMEAGPYGAGNRGLEYDSRPGDLAWSIGAGRVVFAGPVAGRLAVTVQHPDGRRSSLTGLVSLAVAAGELVVRGQVLGVAGERLHLGVREGDRYVDPALLFSAVRRRAVLVP